MEIKKGIGVSPGYRIRRAFVLEEEDTTVPARFLSPKQDVESEIERFHEALKASIRDLEDLKQEIRKKLSPDLQEIFSVHQILLSDPAIRQKVEEKIRNHRCTAEYALTRTMRSYIRKFRSFRNNLFSNRSQDIRDLEKRVLRHLQGKKRKGINDLKEEVIVIAKDLLPSQTATFDKKHVVGFATDFGGKTSHTAILARAFGIPAVVGVGDLTAQVSNDDIVVIDGTNGLVILNPDEKTLKRYQQKERQHADFWNRLYTELKDLPCETLDGYEIKLWANIEVPQEVSLAVENGAEGVGLYRTEFLYLQSGKVPSEKEHLNAYLQALQELKGRPLVIRLLDMGADKYHHRSAPLQEKNPFLGCRSIRYLFEELDILKVQLRAILRASAHGDVRILLPMISSVEELEQAKTILEDIQEELHKQHLAFDENIKVGIMIEVPSAVLIADVLAQKVDFFSIGTNDLIQYTLAVDRVNEKVAFLYQPAHLSILRMLQHVVEVGKKNAIPVSICGEMSREMRYVLPLLGLGLTNISMTPVVIPEVKKIIRSTTLKEAKEVFEKILSFQTSEETEKFLETKIQQMVPDIFEVLQPTI